MAYMKTLPILVLGFAIAVSAGSVDLTGDTFDEVVLGSGKNSLVKFYAPWCGHCKRMAPDWEKLGEEFEGSSSVVIGNVDCTADSNTEMCEKFGVRGYPTVKYFEGGDAEGQPYEGGRDYDSLLEFAKTTLEVLCQVASPAGCSEKETAFIEKMKAKSAEEHAAQLTRLKGMAGKSMAPELKRWVGQRVNILTQLTAEA
uniref:Thioredoxin domain-containing protein n=1 Tax=Pyramimonas obovata TaxID=1411642 RepID=A0A7S0WRY0_9CHLO|mmetsp:Transcript_37227/g.81061  ORF Transcript_37227/g.81061 Transcript_37227/m.81061 type:complete len:199 (+) Transcript_37227:36-632(+)